MEWHPIETAPDDDTPHVRGLWVNVYNAGRQWQCYAGYIDDYDEFVTIDGDETGWDTDQFTHWMPLPEPPK